VRCREDGASCGGVGRAFRLSDEPGNEPRARRSRWRICPVDRVQSNEPVLVLGHVEPDKPPCCDILAHHRFGHIAPADAFLEQHVLRAEIGEPPGLGPDHSEILPLRKQRAVRQHELDVGAPGAGCIPTRQRERMIGSRNGDQLDAADPDAVVCISTLTGCERVSVLSVLNISPHNSRQSRMARTG
jgi:hypothetical protein